MIKRSSAEPASPENGRMEGFVSGINGIHDYKEWEGADSRKLL